jgi:hypothetical protein
MTCPVVDSFVMSLDRNLRFRPAQEDAMFRNLFDKLRRLRETIFDVETPSRRAPQPGRRFRPRVESLEAREVPALCVWTGAVDDQFDTVGNWLGGVPQAGDDVMFSTGPGGARA